MKTLNKIIREAVRKHIISSNGRPNNVLANELCAKYPFPGVVTMIQNAYSYFRFSKCQRSFRLKYGYYADEA